MIKEEQEVDHLQGHRSLALFRQNILCMTVCKPNVDYDDEEKEVYQENTMDSKELDTNISRRSTIKRGLKYSKYMRDYIYRMKKGTNRR